MDSILALGKYGGSDSEESDSGINENALIEQPAHLLHQTKKFETKKTMAVVAAPTVITKESGILVFFFEMKFYFTNSLYL